MGLLDDAIREHLDLKRRSGGDPAEIARAEQEALGPVRREADPPAAAEDAPEAPAPPHHDAAHEDPHDADADADAAADHAPWDAPAHDPVPPEREPEPPRAAHEPELAPAAGAEPDEDVLEETPDFLQETPEHDRLWFEQRPPRDFDFDG